MSLKAFLCRLTDDGKQTLGELRLYDGLTMLFSCKTLEPPWKNNRPKMSCIPVGAYKVTPRTSDKFKQHFLINGTSPREFVLVHAGNYFDDTIGCVLVGRDHTDLNRDGEPDVTFSRVTLDMLIAAVNGRSFTLVIAA